jgi:multiple sugar transport system substrate-binding protein
MNGALWNGAAGVTRRNFMKHMAYLGVGGTALSSLGGMAFGADTQALRLLSEDTDDPELEWYKAVNARFTADHPEYDLQYETVAMATTLEKLTTRLAANDSPDFMPRAGQARVATLASLGVLQPVDDLVEALGVDDFAPEILQQYKFDGHYIAVPQQTLATVYWYRSDLAVQAGLKAPTTWDELLAFAKALTKDGMYGIALAAGVNSATCRKMLEFIRQNGGNVVDENLVPALDTKQNEETLAFLKQLYQYSPPGSANFNFGDLLNNYSAGTVASTFYAGRLLQRAQAKAPELMGKTAAVQEPIKTQAFCFSESSGAFIFNHARNPDGARTYIKDYEFNTQNHINWLLTSPGMNLPVRKSVAGDLAYTGHPLLQKYASIVETIQAQIPTGGNFFRESANHKPNPQAGALDSGPILPTILQRVLVDNEAPKDALAWGQRQLTDLMNG